MPAWVASCWTTSARMATTEPSIPLAMALGPSHSWWSWCQRDGRSSRSGRDVAGPELEIEEREHQLVELGDQRGAGPLQASSSQEAYALSLELHAVFKRAEQVTYVQSAGRTITGQNP